MTSLTRGRLATSSYDGKIRLYDGSFNLLPLSRAERSASQIYRFQPNGTALALGYDDAAAVDILDGRHWRDWQDQTSTG